jgi:hypothetical protein
VREARTGAAGGRGARAPLGETWERGAPRTRARTAGAARGRRMGGSEAGRIADER